MHIESFGDIMNKAVSIIETDCNPNELKENLSFEIRPITINDDVDFLRQRSKEVEFNDKSYLDDIKVLGKYCSTHEVFAMAAVQLGIPKRIIYLRNTSLTKIDDPNWNEARILINPVIKEQIGLTKYWEACASCLNNMGLVARPYKIKLEYYDIFGKKRKATFTNFEATVLSHEYDHLNGILHMDIALELLQMPKEERVEFRLTHGYEILHKTGDYEHYLKEECK